MGFECTGNKALFIRKKTLCKLKKEEINYNCIRDLQHYEYFQYSFMKKFTLKFLTMS